MKVIATEKAPGAIGPYSQGFIAGGFVYTSGQIPVNPADGTVPEGIAAQTAAELQERGCDPGAAGGLRQGHQDHLLPGRYRRLCRLQRGLRKVLHLQARPQLRCRQGSAQGCPVRDRGRGRGVSSRIAPALRSPLYNALKLCHNLSDQGKAVPVPQLGGGERKERGKLLPRVAIVLIDCNNLPSLLLAVVFQHIPLVCNAGALPVKVIVLGKPAINSRPEAARQYCVHAYIFHSVHHNRLPAQSRRNTVMLNLVFIIL